MLCMRAQMLVHHTIVEEELEKYLLSYLNIKPKIFARFYI